jgi:HSP20 family protein
MEKKFLGFPLPTRLSGEVDRLFEELIHRPWRVGRSTKVDAWSPQLDLYETDTAFILEADLPGVKQKDVSVEVENHELVLHGKRVCEHVTTEGNFHRRERQEGEFTRRLRLPASVDQDQIRAEFGNGVLRVSLPKIAHSTTEVTP